MKAFFNSPIVFLSNFNTSCTILKKSLSPLIFKADNKFLLLSPISLLLSFPLILILPVMFSPLETCNSQLEVSLVSCFLQLSFQYQRKHTLMHNSDHVTSSLKSFQRYRNKNYTHLPDIQGFLQIGHN